MNTKSKNESPNGSQNNIEPKKKLTGKGLLKEIMSWVLVGIGGFAAAFIISTFVIVNASVPSGSMMDTIQERSRIVAFRLSYLFSDPERFDVIVFRYPGDESILYVKRIIGIPGDTLEIKGGIVYINGEPIDEPFVRGTPWPENHGPFHIPEDSVFVLGDNRNSSDDSRSPRWPSPFISQDSILGKVIFSYFPTIRAIR